MTKHIKKTTKTVVRRPGLVKTITKASANRNLVRRRQKVRRNPTLRAMRRATPRPTAKAARWCAALLKGDIESDVDTPCANSRAFREIKATWVIRPKMCADGQRAIVVFNKHLMWADAYKAVSAVQDTQDIILNTSGGAASYIQLTPVYSPTASSFAPAFSVDANNQPVGFVQNAGSGEKIIAVSDTNAVGLRATSGDVRFLGGKVTFRQFETALNTGGQLLHVHNPQGLSLIAKYFDAPSNASYTQHGATLQFYGLPPGAVENLRSVTSLSTVTQEPISTVILPHTTEFEKLAAGADTPSTTRTNAQGAVVNVALDEKWMDGFDQVFSDTVGDVNHFGFNEAFIYKPASSKSAGADANCELVFEMHYHVNVGSTANTGFGQTASTQLLNAGVSDARSAAAMQTTIDSIKMARVDDPSTSFTGPSGMNKSMASQAPSILERIARAAPDIAQEVSDLLPPTLMGGVPKMLLSGAATVGRLVFG
jgi:hypothetical protein